MGGAGHHGCAWRLPRLGSSREEHLPFGASTCLDVSLRCVVVRSRSAPVGLFNAPRPPRVSTPDAGSNPRLCHPASSRYSDGFSADRARPNPFGDQTYATTLQDVTVPCSGPGFLAHARRQGGNPSSGSYQMHWHGIPGQHGHTGMIRAWIMSSSDLPPALFGRRPPIWLDDLPSL